MISFWVNAAGSFGMEEYIARRAPALAERIRIRRYESLSPELEVTGGAHIFSALDQLSPAGREVVAGLYDRIREARPADRLLNDPRRVSRRFALLTKMFEAGINDFRARRATEDGEAARFPVFVREESRHNGAVTGLLRSPEELRKALLALRVRGFRLDELLVVEFCDLSGPDGRFQSASAYKIGEQIVPAHRLSGRDWVLKWTGSDHDERAMQQHLEYVSVNPHEAWLRRVFELAEVEYGRVDYGVKGDTLRVWEINLNPTLGPSPGPEPAPFPPKVEATLKEARKVYHENLRQAFEALDPGRDESRATVCLDPGLLARMKAEADRAGRRNAAWGLLARIYESPRAGRLLRAIFPRLLPRR